MLANFITYCHACGKQFQCGDCITMTCINCYQKGHRDFNCHICNMELSHLKELLELETKIKELEQSLERSNKRLDLINRIKHNFPEPLLTAICDILANNNLRPELIKLVVKHGKKLEELFPKVNYDENYFNDLEKMK